METRVKPAYDMPMMWRAAPPHEGSSMTTDAVPPIANADFLTERLRASGVLGAARIRSVALISSQKKLRSHTFRLRLHYEGASGNAPPSVIFKMGHLDSDGRPSYANRN